VHQLLAATCAFGDGIGILKIAKIDLKNPGNLNVRGLSPTTIRDRIIPVFDHAIDRVTALKSMVGQALDLSETVNHGNALWDKTFAFTGFRDPLLERQIIQHGGKVSGSVSKKTTTLVVDTNFKNSAKLEKAKSLDVPVTSRADLVKLLDQLSLPPELEVQYDQEENDSSTEDC
jgi:hypothetical protein